MLVDEINGGGIMPSLVKNVSPANVDAAIFTGIHGDVDMYHLGLCYYDKH
ncbi:MAG: hypothetical protein IPN42_10780 [Methylococcaceae bacterium]|nr:hypothetical protein [Methylococcaceae bacterium]